MSDDSDSETEKKSYNFPIRFAIFAFIAGPASVFGFGVYGRLNVQHSIAAAERGEYMPLTILTLWIVGLISTAVMVFKR